MKSAFTLFFKEVKHNIVSFLLIVLTVFLCVSVVSGMLLYSFTLKGNAEEYYDTLQMWDIKIKSTLGFTREDIIAVSSADGVEKATAVILAESNSSVNGIGNFGTNIFGIDFDSVIANPDSTVAAPRLIKGSYPGNANSCVAVVSHALKSDIKVGDVVTLSGNTGYCTQTEFTVTGLVYSPDFSSYLKTANAVNSNGTEVAIFVRADAFSPEAPYTEINVMLNGAKAIKSFSREYTLFVNTAMGPINVVARDREQKRGSGLSDEIQSNIDKLLKQYDYIKAEGENELEKLDKIIKNMQKSTDDTAILLETQKLNLDKLKESVDAVAGLPEYSEKLADYNQKLLQYQSDFETNEMNKATCEKLKKDHENLSKVYSKKAEEALKKYEEAKNNTQTDYSQQWTLYTRDSNSGFTSVRENIGKISGIFTIAPIFIILLSVLLIVAIIILNMQKRVKEISQLLLSGSDEKPLKIRVTALYAVAAFVGLILGVIASVGTVPEILSEVIAIMYDLPILSVVSLPYIAFTVGLILLAVSVFFARVFFRMLLAQDAHGLIYGKTKTELPILPIIQKLPTLLKIAVRNIFVHKISFLYGSVTVMLITALLFTGFNIANRENRVYENQYTEIQKYNTEVRLKPFVNIETNEAFMDYVDGKDYMPVMKKCIYISLGEENRPLTAIVPVLADNFNEFITVKGGLNSESVVITKGFAKKYGIKKGEEVNIIFKDGVETPVTVTSISQNYLGDYIYIHPEKYTELTNETPSADTVFIKDSYEKNTDEAIKLFETGIVYSVDELKVNYSTASLEYLRILVYTAFTLGTAILGILYYVMYKNRSGEIKALKFSGYSVLNTCLHLFAETALMWLVGAIFGVLCGILINLPFALLNLDGINLSPFISGTALFKTLVISFDIVLLVCIVNLTLRYKKTDR